MSRYGAQRLLQRGYGKDDANVTRLVTGQADGFLMLYKMNAENNALLQGGLTESQWEAAKNNSLLFHPATDIVNQMVANSIDPIVNAVFTFQNGDTVKISQAGFDASGYSAQDQANYQLVRDLYTFLVG